MASWDSFAAAPNEGRTRRFRRPSRVGLQSMLASSNTRRPPDMLGSLRVGRLIAASVRYEVACFATSSEHRRERFSVKQNMMQCNKIRTTPSGGGDMWDKINFSLHKISSSEAYRMSTKSRRCLIHQLLKFEWPSTI